MKLKNFTLFVLSAAIIAGCGEASARKVATLTKKGVTARKEAPAMKADRKQLKAKAAKAASLWRAATEKTYGWTGEEWELDATYSMAFDEKGQAISQESVDYDGNMSSETYTWNENGYLATSNSKYKDVEDEDFVNSSRLTREYDTRVLSFITSNKQELWIDDEWMPSNCYTQTVTRNDKGNVTLMERAVLFMGEYDPTYRLVVTYGADDKASKIEEYDLLYDFTTNEYTWGLSYVYDNIVWETTDGQIVDTENLLTGNNKMKSGVAIDEDGTEMPFTVEYEGENYTLKFNYVDVETDETVFVTAKYAELDFSGEPNPHGLHGFQNESVSQYVSEEEVYEEATLEQYVYDENDLIILEKAVFVFDGEEYIDGMLQGEVEYDPEKGYPLTWTVQDFDYETEEMCNIFRAEYSDYINAAYVQSIIAEDAQPVYYNLQGMKIANPTSGLYIRVKGNKTEKVLVK